MSVDLTSCESHDDLLSINTTCMNKFVSTKKFCFGLSYMKSCIHKFLVSIETNFKILKFVYLFFDTIVDHY